MHVLSINYLKMKHYFPDMLWGQHIPIKERRYNEEHWQMDDGVSEKDSNHHLLPRLRLELWVNGGVE